MKDYIKWIFFDVGSTLVDEHFVYEHIFRDIAEIVHKSYDEIYTEAMDFYKNNKKGDLELVKKYNLSKRTWYKDEEVPYPNVSTCLADLSKHYKIGVIANQSLGTANRLEKYGLLKYINLVIASAEEGCMKPDPRIFEIALQRANCKADEAIMVGDRVDNDIIPAKKIGMHTIWMKQGYGQYWPITNENQKADYVVNNIMDVYELLS